MQHSTTNAAPLLPGLEAPPKQIYFPRRTADKPVGGYTRLMVVQISLLWWLYISKQIQLLHLRVYFACHELAEQCRCGRPPDELTVDDLRKVVRWQGGQHLLKKAARHLEALGLMTWDAAGLSFATAPTDLQGSLDLTGYHTMLQGIENNRRCVPIPRQLIRMIAQGCGTIRLATLLGHLLRCLYYRHGQCVSGGRCKASWVATVFGVDRGQVKRERRRLLALGIMEREPKGERAPDPQWLLNRDGHVIYFSLTWTQAGLREAGTRCSDVQGEAATQKTPPPVAPATQKTPPDSNQKLFSDLNYRHQKRKPATPTGVPSIQDRKAEAPLPAPTLKHFIPEDFENLSRQIALYDEATTRGLIGKSDAGRLTFLSTMQHAGSGRDPGALLAANVKHGRWYYADWEEDVTRRRLRAHLYGADRRPRPSSPRPVSAPPSLSEDARIMQAVQQEWTRLGQRGDPWAYVHAQDPTWTRERWDQAVSELARAQRIRQVRPPARILELGEMEDREEA